MNTTEIKDMIQKYHIEDGHNGKLRIFAKVTPTDVELIRSAKAEILSYFESERSATAQAEQHEREIFESIPGLTQLRDARSRWSEWNREFNRRMEDEALSSVLPAAPTDDLKALESKYPDAVFALKIDDDRQSANYVIAEIAQKTYRDIVSGASFSKVKADYDKSMSEYTTRKMWD